MKNQSIIYSICMVVLVAVIFTAGCTLTSGGTVTPTQVPTTVPVTIPADTPVSATCGFTTCHGLDLACGMDAPHACTMLYQIGDKCRHYARCDASGGGCNLVIEPKFTACKACTERCQIQAGPDSLAAMTCEEKC